MSQHDYTISNAPGASVRADINSLAEAVVTLNSGATEPSTMYARMLWADTTNNLVKMRNASNTAWIILFAFTTSEIPGKLLAVQEYGASPAATGAANTTGFNAALTAGSIIVHPGTYTIGSSITVPNNRLVYLMPGAVLKAANVAWGSTGILDLNAVSNVTIEGGTLDGDKANNATGQVFGIAIRDASNVIVRGIRSINMPASTAAGGNGGDGIYVGGSASPGSTDVKILGVTCDANVRQGISVVKGSRIVIANSHFLNTTGTNPGAGIDLEVNTGGDILREITIQGNIFSGNHYGVAVASGDAQQISIMGNTFRNQDGADIMIQGKDITVQGNTFDIGTKGVRAGYQFPGAIYVYATTASKISIIGNRIVGNYNADERGGIVLGKGATRVTIAHNVISKTGSIGIWIGRTDIGSGNIRTVTIIGNILEDCVVAGATVGVIRLGTSGADSLDDVTIIGNQIYDSRSGGDEADVGIEFGNITGAMRATMDFSDNHFVGVAASFTSGQSGVPTANLPAAGTLQNGRTIIEDAGAGDRNLIVYAEGQRFRLDGGSAI